VTTHPQDHTHQTLTHRSIGPDQTGRTTHEITREITHESAAIAAERRAIT
jgi:hypothetical protein